MIAVLAVAIALLGPVKPEAPVCTVKTVCVHPHKPRPYRAPVLLCYEFNITLVMPPVEFPGLVLPPPDPTPPEVVGNISTTSAEVVPILPTYSEPEYSPPVFVGVPCCEVGHIPPPSSGGTMRAPEIDPSCAVSGLTLLFGALTVVRGRKK